MGAWGTGVFDNDMAMDWCGDFVDAAEGEGDEEQEGKHVLLLGPIQMVAQPEEDEVDADDASVALAAAEVIAALNGQPSDDFAKVENETRASLVAWSRANTDELLRRPEIRVLAARAAQRVLDDSELAELWGEVEDAEAWRSTVRDLIERLNRA